MEVKMNTRVAIIVLCAIVWMGTSGVIAFAKDGILQFFAFIFAVACTCVVGVVFLRILEIDEEKAK